MTAKRNAHASIKDADDHEDDDDDDERMPRGPREPGVGAEKGADDDVATIERPRTDHQSPAGACCAALLVDDNLSAAASASSAEEDAAAELPSLNFARELDSCDVVSTAGNDDGGEADAATSSQALAIDYEANAAATDEDAALEALRRHVKLLAARPVDGGGDGQQTQDVWETELNATVDRLDRLLMHRENNAHSGQLAATLAAPSAEAASMPATPLRTKANRVVAAADTPTLSVAEPPSPVRQLLKAEPLPQAVVSMSELPLLSRLSTELSAVSNRLLLSAAKVQQQQQPDAHLKLAVTAGGGQQQRRRSLE